MEDSSQPKNFFESLCIFFIIISVLFLKLKEESVGT